MKSWDVIVAGAGVIGLSLAWTLQKAGAKVLVVDRGEPAREASFAAAGMLAVCDPHTHPKLRPLAECSAALYSEFVDELRQDSRLAVEFRTEGVIAFLDAASLPALHPRSEPLTGEMLAEMEAGIPMRSNAYFLPERWVDPRSLCTALLTAFRGCGGDLVSGSPVTSVECSDGRVIGVRTEQSHYRAGMIANCCGAWAGLLGPEPFPTRPVKGHMLSIVPLPDAGSHKPLLRHVVRAPGVYLVPRNDGRVVIGSTLEETGYDKSVDPATIQHLQQAAIEVVPEIGKTRIHEVWAGLRPGTPDNLPLLGATRIEGYFVAAGHYRDGILLAPATAAAMAALMTGAECAVDLQPFAPDRFQ